MYVEGEHPYQRGASISAILNSGGNIFPRVRILWSFMKGLLLRVVFVIILRELAAIVDCDVRDQGSV